MNKQMIINKFNIAVQLEKSSNHIQALQEYKEIIKLDPSCREAYINIGSLYSRMNKLKKAMVFYENALSLGKDYLTFFNIGSIYYKMGKFKRAIINLEKSKALNSRFILSSLVLGLCYSMLSNYRASEVNFSDVRKIVPDNRVALTALAILYYNQGRFDDSIKLLDRLIAINGLNVRIRELKSSVLYKAGMIKETAKEIKSITKISDGYRYYDEFIKSVPVEVYTDKYGTINEKIDSLKKNVKDDKDSLISLSLCHLFKGDTETAIDYLFRYKNKATTI